MSTNCDKNDTAKCNNCNSVINELLAFVCNKVDTLAETAIVQICLSAFGDIEIENARQLVYKLLAPNKKVMRRKEGNQQKSIQEIVKIIKETEPDSLPIFTAKDLNKLPPVTFDHIDVTTFLKEMSILKKEMARMASASAASLEIEFLKKEIQHLKTLVQDIASGECVAKNHECQLTQKSPHTSNRNNSNNNKNKEVVITESREAIASNYRSSASGESGERAGRDAESTGACAVNESTADSSDHVAPVEGEQAHTGDTAIDASISVSGLSMADIVKTNGEHKNTRPNNDDEGWTRVQNKRQKIKNRRGAAKPLEQFNFRAADRTVSLYVSRVHVDTTAGDIEGFIRHKTSINVKAYKINRFNNEFNAFKVVVPSKHIDTFLNDKGDQFWPTDIVFRRYWERSRLSTSKGNTSQKR